MFGERILLNVVETCIVDKYRLILPAYTKAEDEDLVVLLLKENFIEVWPDRMIAKRLEDLENRILDIDDEVKRAKFQRMSDEITSCAKSCSVDRQRRIFLGRELVEKYGIEKKFVIEGKGNYLRLWSPEKFKEYEESLAQGSVRGK